MKSGGRDKGILKAGIHAGSLSLPDSYLREDSSKG